MQRTYYTDSDTIGDYLDVGCDDGTTVTDTALDHAATEIAHKSRYSWNEREALAFCATLSDDERAVADDYSRVHSDPDVVVRSIGHHACRVAFMAVHRAATLDLRAALADLAALADTPQAP